MIERVLLSGPRLPDRFKADFVRHIRKTIEVSGRNLDGHSRRKMDGRMTTFASYVESLPQDALSLRNLWLLQLGARRRPPAEGSEYEPGTQESRVLALVGTSPASPSPPELLEELIGAAIEDREKAYAEHTQAAVRERGDELKRTVVARAHDAAERAQEAAGNAKAKLATVEAERNAARAEAEHLKLLVPEGVATNGDAPTEAPPGETSEKPPRRRKVEGYTGVYETPRGLEIGWTQDGRQHWKALGEVSVDEAVAARKAKVEAV